jgi:signal transduction histidine kinase
MCTSLSIIQNSALLLNFLVSDMIDLFKIRNKLFKANEVISHPKELVLKIFDIFSIQSREKGLELKVLFDQSVPHLLKIDESRFN